VGPFAEIILSVLKRILEMLCLARRELKLQ
jgi:hypothetical protein